MHKLSIEYTDSLLMRESKYCKTNSNENSIVLYKIIFISIKTASQFFQLGNQNIHYCNHTQDNQGSTEKKKA